jgi:DNA-binding beta-propeller fold protein YncE
MSINYLLLSLCVLLYFVSGLQSQENTLGDTLGSFNAGIVTPTPDRLLNGVEFADGHFWITGADPDDSYHHKLYKLDADGQLVDYFDYGLEFAGWSDMAYDGEYLYVADIDTIRQIDMSNGSKTGVKIPGPEYYLNGLAYDAGSDRFWVSGDGNLIYEIDRDGNITNAISFTVDLPAAGLAWDSWTAGGPYLWVWSMKYTSSDVRPKAFQIKPATGLLTGLEFEGVIMHPNGQNAADYALGATISDELIDDKVALIGLHGSSYQASNDQLDWIVSYDLDPEGVGVPGPVISVDPQTIENDLYEGDSVDVAVVISNLSADFGLEWMANLEYPGSDTSASAGDTLQNFNASVLTIDTNTRMRGVAFVNDHIYISSGIDFNSRFYLYKYEKEGNLLLDKDTLYSAFSGWTAITSDEQYIYGAQTYQINVYDPESKTLVETFPRPNFSPDGLAYDPQQEHFYLGNGVGAIMQINKQGEELNFYVVPYEIEGLSWDNWSPGGPFLWAYYRVDEASERINAVRLDPATGKTTGVEFFGVNLSGNNDFPDEARDIFVTPAWQQDRLTMIALHNSTDTADYGQDKVIVYDLDATPAPGWIEMLAPSFGETSPLTDDTLYIRLMAIMEDTLTTAQLVLKSNDVLKPEVIIPVNFTMLPGLPTGLDDRDNNGETVQITMYPNPVDNYLQVQISDLEREAELSCYDAKGYLLFSEMMDPGMKSIRVATSELQAGIYFIRISDNEGLNISRKMVKH